jgi:hypothetical protein
VTWQCVLFQDLKCIGGKIVTYSLLCADFLLAVNPRPFTESKDIHQNVLTIRQRTLSENRLGALVGCGELARNYPRSSEA